MLFLSCWCVPTEGPSVQMLVKAVASSSSGDLPRFIPAEKLAPSLGLSISRLSITCSHWDVQLEIQIVLFCMI